MFSCWRSQPETKGDSRDVAIIAFQCSHVVVFESPLHVRRLSVPYSYSYNRTDKGLPEPCLYMFLNTSELYSYFEKGCRKMHSTIPKGNMGYNQYKVPDDWSCRTYFCCFPLALANTSAWPFVPILSNFLLKKKREPKTTHNAFQDCRVHFFRQPFSK